MAEWRLSMRLDEDYIERLDTLCARLGINRTQLVKNLLSGDPGLIGLIAEKASTLNQVSIDEVMAKTQKRGPKRGQA